MNTNVVVICGNLTRDPELRYTPSGTAVASLRVAVNDRIKKDDQWQDVPYYFNVTVWGKAAENAAQYLAKGRKVAVHGKLTWREWEQDGNKRQAVDIVAREVEYLTPKGEGEGGGGWVPDGQPYGTQSSEEVPTASGDFAPKTVDDDIPF